MAVSVTVRVCARRVRTGATLVPGVEGTSGRSAGSIVNEKSIPEERSTRDDGKNLSDVTPLRCGFEGVLDNAVSTSCGIRDLRGCSKGSAGYRKTEPSRYPVAKREESGAISNAVILWGCRTSE